MLLSCSCDHPVPVGLGIPRIHQCVRTERNVEVTTSSSLPSAQAQCTLQLHWARDPWVSAPLTVVRLPKLLELASKWCPILLQRSSLPPFIFELALDRSGCQHSGSCPDSGSSICHVNAKPNAIIHQQFHFVQSVSVFGERSVPNGFAELS